MNRLIRRWRIRRATSRLVALGWDRYRAQVIARICVGLDVPIDMVVNRPVDSHWENEANALMVEALDAYAQASLDLVLSGTAFMVRGEDGTVRRIAPDTFVIRRLDGTEDHGQAGDTTISFKERP